MNVNRPCSAPFGILSLSFVAVSLPKSWTTRCHADPIRFNHTQSVASRRNSRTRFAIKCKADFYNESDQHHHQQHDTNAASDLSNSNCSSNSNGSASSNGNGNGNGNGNHDGNGSDNVNANANVSNASGQGALEQDHQQQLSTQCKEMIMSSEKGKQQQALLLMKKLDPLPRLELLQMSLSHSKNEFIRATATIMLGQIENMSRSIQAQCFNLLEQLLLFDSDYGVRAAAAAAMGHLGDKAAVDILIRSCYEETEWQVQFSALVALGDLKDDRALPVLTQYLNDPNDILVQGAVGALGEIGNSESIEALLLVARDAKDIMTKQRLAAALGVFVRIDPDSGNSEMDMKHDQRDRILASLKELANDSHQFVAESAIDSLKRAGEDVLELEENLEAWNEDLLESSILQMLEKNMDEARDHLERSLGSAPLNENANEGKTSRDEQQDTGVLSASSEHPPPPPQFLSEAVAGARSLRKFPTKELQTLYRKLTPGEAGQYESLLDQLRGQNESECVLALIRLRSFPVPLAEYAVISSDILSMESERIRSSAVSLLIRNIPVLRGIALHDEDHTVRSAALDVLSQAESSYDVISTCIKALLEDEHWLCRMTAATALSMNAHGFKPAEDALLQCLESYKSELPGMTASQSLAIRRYIITAVGSLGVTRAVSLLMEISRYSSDQATRLRVAGSLSGIMCLDSIYGLEELALDDDPEVAILAENALRYLQSEYRGSGSGSSDTE